MPKIPADEQPQTLYVKRIKKGVVKRIKKMAIDEDSDIGAVIERLVEEDGRRKEAA